MSNATKGIPLLRRPVNQKLPQIEMILLLYIPSTGELVGKPLNGPVRDGNCKFLFYNDG